MHFPTPSAPIQCDFGRKVVAGECSLPLSTAAAFRTAGTCFLDAAFIALAIATAFFFVIIDDRLFLADNFETHDFSYGVSGG